MHWPDGTILYAEIQPGQDAIDALHDACHETLAKAMGLAASSTLRAAAGVPGHDPVECGYEEAAVLAIQELARYRLRLSQ
jgi:hypothetical protein